MYEYWVSVDSKLGDDFAIYKGPRAKRALGRRAAACIFDLAVCL